MHSFTQAAITKYHELGDLNSSNICCPDLKVRSPRSRFLQGWFPLRAVRENRLQDFVLTAGGLLPIFGVPVCVETAP